MLNHLVWLSGNYSWEQKNGRNIKNKMSNYSLFWEKHSKFSMKTTPKRFFFSSKDFLTTRKKTVIAQNSSSLDILDITTCSVKGTDLSLLWPHHSANGCCRNTTGYKWKHSGILIHIFWKTLFFILGAGACGSQRPWIPLKLECQGLINHVTWMPGI